MKVKNDRFTLPYSARLLLVALLLLQACTTQYLGISASPDHCCAGDSYQSFSVKAEDIPAFLGPIIVSNFSVAMAEKGLQPVVEGGDLRVSLRYEQDDLSESASFDDFDERIADDTTHRFVARIKVEMVETGSGNLVWSGSIQRIHDIRPGDYMHTGNASVAFLGAFRELLQGYPG